MPQKDYPELEGKEITWKFADTGREIQAIVIGCSYDIGITIEKKNQKGSHLCCYNGPSSPKAFAGGIKNKANYKKIFYYKIDQIKKGLIDCKETKEFQKPFMQCNSHNLILTPCPFSQ